MPAARIRGILLSCLLSFTAINKLLPALLRHQFPGVEHRSARMNSVNVGGVFAVLFCPCPSSTSGCPHTFQSCDDPAFVQETISSGVPNGRTPVASRHVGKCSDNGYAGPHLVWHRLHLTRIGAVQPEIREEHNHTCGTDGSSNNASSRLSTSCAMNEKSRVSIRSLGRW